MPSTKSRSKLKFSSQTITPNQAKNYLDNRRNPSRNVSNLRVNEYARIMQEGLWKEIPQPLIFDDEGGLLDGQQRLLAVIRSGSPQDFTVCTGADPEVIATLDSGRKRTAYDYLTTQGIPNANSISYLLSHSRNSRLYSNQVWARLKGLDYHTYLLEYNRSPEIYQQCVLAAYRLNRAFRHINRTDYALAAYRLVNIGGYSLDDALDFLTMLSSGMSDGKTLLPKNSPIRVLKEWLEVYSYKYYARRAARQIMANNIMSTFNAHHKGETWKKDKFSERPLLPTIMPLHA